jgi:dipeptidase
MRGGRDAEQASAWWRFKRLLTAVEQDFGRHARRVRETWRRYERDLDARTERVAADAAGKPGAERAALLEAFMAEVWLETARQLDALVAEVES